ncbi:MAG: RNA polymerase sigma factor SigZ [Balneolaceae bacterium]|nr:RNA polymerase sigma factor SigZ [Balneolaceae bacterium]
MKNTTVNWHAYRSNLYAFILKRVGSATVAEDIVQDVLLKAYKSQDTLQDSGKLRKWFFQIARNAVIDYYRTHRKTEPLPHAFAGDEPTTQNNTEHELTACLKPFIKKLPEPYQKAIILSELEGLTQQEVASLLGLSHSGAKSRIQRGREILEGMFFKCCKIELDSRGSLMEYKPNQPCNNC